MVKRKKTHRYSKNASRAWRKKKKQQKQPSIACEQIRNAWDSNKSVARNLKDMGLSADPNKTLRILTTKERLLKPTTDTLFESTEGKPVIEKVVKELELEASAVQPCRLDMSDPDVQFCRYMIDKHGDNYVAMARDKRNFYQDTPSQIKRKIEKFKKIPKFNVGHSSTTNN